MANEPWRKAKAFRNQRMIAARRLGTHKKEEWTYLVKLCGDRCVRCGLEGRDVVCKDHIVPVYQGGSDGLENIQPLCPPCNASKGPENIDHRPVEVQEWVKTWVQFMRPAEVDVKVPIQR